MVEEDGAGYGRGGSRLESRAGILPKLSPWHHVGATFHHSGPWWLGTPLLSCRLENTGERCESRGNGRGFLHRFLIFGRSPGLMEPSLGKFSASEGKCRVYLLLLLFWFGISGQGIRSVSFMKRYGFWVQFQLYSDIMPTWPEVLRQLSGADVIYGRGCWGAAIQQPLKSPWSWAHPLEWRLPMGRRRSQPLFSISLTFVRGFLFGNHLRSHLLSELGQH